MEIYCNIINVFTDLKLFNASRHPMNYLTGLLLETLFSLSVSSLVFSSWSILVVMISSYLFSLFTSNHIAVEKIQYFFCQKHFKNDSNYKTNKIFFYIIFQTQMLLLFLCATQMKTS